jgi:hypothetical protein
MPVIIAGLQAARGAPDTSANPSIANFVINGPIAKEIGINSSWHYLGPNPYYPANGAIGRTLMMLSHTVGGNVPGVTNMQPNGSPGDYNSIVFAEAEDISPWDPLSIERGFAKGTNTITYQSCQSTVNLTGPQNAAYADQYLKRTVAKDMAYPHSNWGRPQAGMLVIPPAAARALAELRYSKQDVKQALWEGARHPWSWWEDVISIYKGGKGSPGWDDNVAAKLASVPWLKQYLNSPPDALVPIAEKPDSFIIVVAGADQLAHWTFLMGGLGGAINTVEIKTPKNWAELLKQAPKFWGGAPPV